MKGRLKNWVFVLSVLIVACYRSGTRGNIYCTDLYYHEYLDGNLPLSSSIKAVAGHDF